MSRSERVRGTRHVLRAAILCVCVTGMLVGCGPVSSSQNRAHISINPGAENVAQAALVPPDAPPGANQRPLQPGQSGTQYLPNGLPALQPMGVNVDQLFAQDIRDPIQRIKRVENAVVDLRRELNAFMPAIVRLVAVEDDIQNLIVQLESLLGTGGTDMPAAQMAPVSDAPPLALAPQSQPANKPVQDDDIAREAGVPVTAPTPAPVPSPKAESKPAPVTGEGVLDVRLGAHSGKTRLVLDIAGKTAHRADLDNDEKLLVIELPDAKWSAATTRNFSDKIIAGYNAQPMNDGKGTRLVVQLKGASAVLYNQMLAPEGGARNHRLVIDLQAP